MAARTFSLLIKGDTARMVLPLFCVRYVSKVSHELFLWLCFFLFAGLEVAFIYALFRFLGAV